MVEQHDTSDATEGKPLKPASAKLRATTMAKGRPQPPFPGGRLVRVADYKPHEQERIRELFGDVEEIWVDTSFADLMTEAAEDGRLDAHRLRPNIFDDRPVAPSMAEMRKAIVRVAEEAEDDGLIQELYAVVYRFENSKPLDAAADPYPRAGAIGWPDWEIATRARLLTETSRGLSPREVAGLLSVWLLTAPARRVVGGAELLVAIEKRMRNKRWLDGKGHVRPMKSNIEKIIAAAMRAAGIRSSGPGGPDRRKAPFRKD